MGVQVYEDVPIGEIKYLTENIGDVPISVYVIQGKNGDMLVDTGFYSTYKSIIKWIEKNEFNITDILLRMRIQIMIGMLLNLRKNMVQEYGLLKRTLV